MFEKNLRLAYLLDFYGDVLDEHTRGVMKAYYDDDLSLSEIAEGVGISRQGVRHVIKKGEEQLEFLESRLKLAAHNERLREVAEDLTTLSTLLGEQEDERLCRGAEMLTRSVDIILNKG